MKIHMTIQKKEKGAIVEEVTALKFGPGGVVTHFSVDRDPNDPYENWKPIANHMIVDISTDLGGDKMLEPQEEREYCDCEECGDPIMVGYDYYDTQDGKVHEDCFEEFAKKKLQAKMRTAGDDL